MTAIQDIQTVAELVLEARTGSQFAFERLYERYVGRVTAIARQWLKNDAAAQELVQEVFLQAYLKLDQRETPEAFGGWIAMIARRMALNSLGRQKQAVATEPEILEATCAQISSPDEGVLADEAKEQLRAGLSRLGKLDRKTLEAFYFEGQSLVEMAEAFDAPVGTIKRRLHVARKRLAQQLEPMASA